MAHHSKILAQLLKLVPRHECEALAKRYHKGRRLHSMTRWVQFVTLGQRPTSRRCWRCSSQRLLCLLDHRPVSDAGVKVLPYRDGPPRSRVDSRDVWPRLGCHFGIEQIDKGCASLKPALSVGGAVASPGGEGAGAHEGMH